METNFFRQIADLGLTGNLQLTIAKGAEDKYVVSVLLLNKECKDKAKNQIVPCNLRETPEELDRQFFKSIITPMQTVSELMVNMNLFHKQVEEAKKNSAMSKPTKPTKTKPTAQLSKYEIAMAKVDELDKAGKPRDAWMKLPDPSEFPDHAETIRKRRSELSAKFAPDLFATKVEEPEHSNTDLEEEENKRSEEEFEDEDFGETEAHNEY